MVIIDAKILRSGTSAAVVLLFTGLFIGTFGGWQPILNLVNSIVGMTAVTIAFSVALVFIYSQWFANFLPGSSLLKGALFGFLVWVLFLILGGLFPFFKASVYPSQNPISSLFLSLVVLSFWGSTAVLTLESKN